MILYHGSNVSIETVDLSKSKRYKDFGQAFYLSAERASNENGRSKGGAIADDYVGLQIRDFKRHAITFEQFLQNIHYHKGITYQYAFCTQKAVDSLVRI